MNYENTSQNQWKSFSQHPSLLDDFLSREWAESSLGTWKNLGTTLPAVNVKETNNDFSIEVAAPGMNRDDFKVELANHVLTISSQQEDQREENNQNDGFTGKEFSHQSFQRSFSLPETKVEGEKISAKYEDGILYVTVPKKEEAKVKPVRQIAVD